MYVCMYNLGFPCGSDDIARDPGLIPGSGSSPGERNGTALQYSCLENPMDRGARQATVHVVAKSWTWLSDFTSLFGIITLSGLEKMMPTACCVYYCFSWSIIFSKYFHAIKSVCFACGCSTNKNKLDRGMQFVSYIFPNAKIV